MAYCFTVAFLSAIGLATATSPAQYPPAPSPRELSPSPSPEGRMLVPSPSTPPPPVPAPTPAPAVPAVPVTAATGVQPTWAPAPAVTAAPVTAAPVTAAPPVVTYPPAVALPAPAPASNIPAVLAPTANPADVGSSALSPDLVEKLRTLPAKIQNLPQEIKANPTINGLVDAVKRIPADVNAIPARFKALPPKEQTEIVLGGAVGTAALAGTIAAIAKASHDNKAAAAKVEDDAPHFKAKEVAEPVNEVPLEPAPVGVAEGPVLAPTPAPSPAYALYAKEVEPAAQMASGSGVDGLVLGVGSFMLFSCFFVMVSGLLYYKICGGTATRSFTRLSEQEDDEEDEYA